MAMGKKAQEQQDDLWLATGELPQSPGHPFYEALNRILDKHGFDPYVEQLCAPFYAEKLGRPSMPPGVYFRLLLIGYFEGIDSERGIAWRVADSLALRQFLGLELRARTPDHSTMSKTRKRIDVETHEKVFQWVLRVLAKENLLKGKTLGVDATTLEANAALRSIIRRDTGETYDEFLRRLAKESGVETPTREDLVKLDKKRPKKTSNQEWRHPHDPDSRVTKMKDGRTHLAHKPEHAVDMETGAVVAVNLTHANEGDPASLPATLEEAMKNLESVASEPSAEHNLSGDLAREVVTDKGYHSNEVMVMLDEGEFRGYVSEPDRGKRSWDGKREERDATYANRRRIRGKRGKQLMKQRGELIERPFAHVYDTGGMRRVHLRGHPNIIKRLLVHVAGFNLSLIMRKLVGRGTPRGLAALQRMVLAAFHALCTLVRRLISDRCVPIEFMHVSFERTPNEISPLPHRPFSTGC